MIQNHRPYRSLVVFAAAWVAACAPAISGSHASGTLPPGFDARTVEIRHHWTGLSMNSPVDAVIRLERQGGTYTFTGTSELSVGRDEGHRKAGPLPITVPDTAMLGFLRTLASAPRRTGEYRPTMTHTDDYPEVTITLQSDAGVVEFFTSSQTDRPWRVTIGGQPYVSDSALPFEALQHVDRFVRSADLDRILIEAGAGRP